VSLFQQLTTKPWVTDQGSVVTLPGWSRSTQPAARIALRMFLAVVGVLFMLLIIAYGARMVYPDWRPTPAPALLWTNTWVLILASVALQWAKFSVRRGRLDAMRFGLLAAGVLTVLFLTGQILAWRQLRAMEFFDITNPAIAFFYLATGLHGLHIVGGMVAWARTVGRVWGEFDLARIRRNVELCTTYWHFLLGVWLVLFGLLFSGDNLNIVLKFCGLKQ
jgi:cytochrome c oxidase subunit III